MPLSQATRARIKDLEYLLRGHRQRIRTTQTTLMDDGFYQRSLVAHALAVKQAEKALVKFIASRANGPAIIAEAQADCRRVLADIQRLKSETKLDKLAKMRERMVALESEND